MKRKLTLLFVAGLASILLLFIGCGDQPTATDTPVAPTPTTGIPPTLSTQLPDLEITGYQVLYDDCPWGGPGQISVVVNNYGVADAGPFAVLINGETTMVEGLTVLNETDTAVTFLSGPVGAINAEVDSAQQVVESDETNNLYSIIFTPPPPCETPEP